MISIIIPAKNAASTIECCLNALLTQDFSKKDYEIIVVDDGSVDNTSEIISSFAGVKLIKQNNLGPGAARNTGVQNARGEIVAFTDADCVPVENWLEQISKPFNDHEVVGVKGVYRTCQKSWVARFVQMEYEFKYQRMARQDTIDFIDTSSAAYLREIFLKNGGFDPAYLKLQDQEFSFRLSEKGYRMVYSPGAIVYHFHDRTIGEYFKRKFLIGYWKSILLRNLPGKTFRDSHTPASQRLHIMLVIVMVVALVFGVLIKPLLWLALTSILLFLVISIPLIEYIYFHDKPVCIVAFPLLLERAFAQLSGLIVGQFALTGVHPRPQQNLKPIQRFSKRMIDIFGSFLGLLTVSPFLILISILIKIDTPGSIFYIQERVGENGKPFRMVKFRTMVKGADKIVEQFINLNPLKGPVYKIPNDPRITRIGRFLRRWSIDELPQLWNILRGEMSLVGPRPEETWVVAQYNDAQRQRLVLKPGLTGPMQIRGRGVLDMDIRLKLEIEYIRNYSLIKDINILLRTIPAVIYGKGAF